MATPSVASRSVRHPGGRLQERSDDPLAWRETIRRAERPQRGWTGREDAESIAERQRPRQVAGDDGAERRHEAIQAGSRQIARAGDVDLDVLCRTDRSGAGVKAGTSKHSDQRNAAGTGWRRRVETKVDRPVPRTRCRNPFRPHALELHRRRHPGAVRRERHDVARRARGIGDAGGRDLQPIRPWSERGFLRETRGDERTRGEHRGLVPAPDREECAGCKDRHSDP